MDLALFVTVLWRSRLLVLAGVLLGAVLAVLAYGQPGFSGGSPTITPRSAEVWKSESQLLIAQAGYPYRQSAETAEPSRPLGSLSPIYANLANGEVMRSEIRRQLGTEGTVKASEDIDLAASSFLPFVNFAATAHTRSQAARLAHGAASIFQTYVARQQAASGIPTNRRIQLVVVQAGTNPKLIEGHELSIPILVLVAVMIATVAIVLVRENIRQRREADERPTAADTHALRPLVDAASEQDPEHAARPNGIHEATPSIHRDPMIRGNVQR